MDLDQMKYFCDLVRVQSFTKVAELNFISQPAVSLSIQKLEEDLGVKLLERTTRRVLPTEEGRIFHEYARDILERVREARSVLLERQEKMLGTLSLATVHSVGLHELPVYLKEYIRRYPEVNIHIGVAGFSGNRKEVEQLFPGCTEDQYTLMALGNLASHGSTKGCNDYNRDYIDYILPGYQQYATAAHYPAHNY